MTDQMTGREIAGHEIAGHENARHLLFCTYCLHYRYVNLNSDFSVNDDKQANQLHECRRLKHSGRWVEQKSMSGNELGQQAY